MRFVPGGLVALVIGLVAPVQAQHHQTDFPPEEFKARWARLFDRIGNDAVAVVHGAGLATGYNLPRQSNTFYYLTGIETPHAYLCLDGRTKKVTLYLPPRNERLERAEGRVYSAEDSEAVMRLVGVDAVASTASMSERWPLDEGRAVAIYAEFAPAEGYAESRGELLQAQAAIAADPWDGRTSRESRFRELLLTRNPRAELKNLTPILDELRAIKSEREIALVRRASQLAGLALMEAMRSTEAGVWEYQLDAAARYVFIVNGARLDAYRPITASGTENINNMHYYRSSRQLRDGDLVLMDYAPDYRYYVSDVGRVWPVSGNYLPGQRELLQFVLEYHKVVLSKVRPGVTPQQILASAKEAMQPVFARTTFSKPIYEAAASGSSRRAAARSRTWSAWPFTTSAAIAPGSSRGTCSRSIPSCVCRRRTSTSATKTPSSSPTRDTRTSPTSCRWSSTPSKGWYGSRESCRNSRRAPPTCSSGAADEHRERDAGLRTAGFENPRPASTRMEPGSETAATVPVGGLGNAARFRAPRVRPPWHRHCSSRG